MLPSSLTTELESFVKSLLDLGYVQVRQRFEMLEFLSIEGRNKYVIESGNGLQVAYAAEQSKGILGFLMRYFLGHWRSFELLFFGPDRQIKMRTLHPFRFFFQRLEVMTPEGQRIGALQQRFAIFSKKFDVEDAQGNVLLEMRSPIWRIWTFPFKRLRTSADGRAVAGAEVARVEKQWSGLFSEALTDRDTFRITFKPGLEPSEVPMVLAAGIFVDLQYFEKKASR